MRKQYSGHNKNYRQFHGYGFHGGFHHSGLGGLGALGLALGLNYILGYPGYYPGYFPGSYWY